MGRQVGYGRGDYRNDRTQSRRYRNDDQYKYEKEQWQEPEPVKDDVIVFAEPMEFASIDNDYRTVSSTVCVYSVEELCGQEKLQQMKRSQSRSRSRSRHRHRK